MGKLWDKRAKRVNSIPYYIEEVVRYSTKCKVDDCSGDQYPPVMAEMMLGLLMEVRSFFFFGRILVGFLLALVIKLLLKF